MDPLAMYPFGQALLDFFKGNTQAACTIRRDDGYHDLLPVSDFFRQAADFSPIERTATEYCRGRILDVGAGAGAHSLDLQAHGLEVVAIDVCQAAVDILIARGVAHAICADVFDRPVGVFDTVLLMMHGIGLVENLAGLERFLRHAHHLIGSGGQILVDSLDVRATQDPMHVAYQEANQQRGAYVGEVRMHFEYRGQVGPSFCWLHVDAGTLSARANRMGWRTEVLLQQSDGNYLARLTPAA